MPAPLLTSRQRKQLRAMAHPLKPIVQVGQSGIADGVIEAVNRALHDHELIKVQMHQPQDKKAMAQQLADATSSSLCGLLGHTVILYRPHPDEPKIKILPA